MARYWHRTFPAKTPFALCQATSVTGMPEVYRLVLYHSRKTQGTAFPVYLLLPGATTDASPCYSSRPR